MSNLRKLRLLISLLWILIFALILSIKFYDPTLPANIRQAINLVGDLSHNLFFTMVFYLENITLIYFSVMLWFGQRSGKWAFVIFILLDIINSLNTVGVFAGWDALFDELTTIMMGIILALIFLSPLRDEIDLNRTLKPWPVIGIFFMFFSLWLVQLLLIIVL